MIIGNLTRDPELRYTPSGAAVVTFGVATNRQWTNQQGQSQEEVQFHNVVAWGKLAEICAQILSKGKKVFIQGRLQTREWEDKEGNRRQTTEVVADQMIALSYGGGGAGMPLDERPEPVKKKSVKKEETKKSTKKTEEKVDKDDIPF
jgi:single-strand DNA-binding protein